MLRLTRYFHTAALTLLLPTLAMPSLALAASAESGTVVEQQTRASWHQGIGRGYQALASDSETLLQQAKAYCQKPSMEARNALESNWKQAFGAWQRVRFVDFGPVETNNRAWHTSKPITASIFTAMACSPRMAAICTQRPAAMSAATVLLRCMTPRPAMRVSTHST